MSIRFENVSKSFGKKVVLRDIRFEVARGEILFILGKSGVGKSVTLKHIVGVLRPDAGRVWVDDQDVTLLDAHELATVRRKCGMVFQHPALLDSLSVYQNVSFGLRTPQYLASLSRDQPLPEADIEERVITTLAHVNLGPDVLNRSPNEISYGMQKRVSLARTLAPQPEFLLFDEPTTGLDPITTNAVNRLIQQLSRTLKVTSIVVSHDMQCALAIADRVLVLDQGSILALEPTAQIRTSKIPLIRDFLSEAIATEQSDAEHAQGPP